MVFCSEHDLQKCWVFHIDLFFCRRVEVVDNCNVRIDLHIHVQLPPLHLTVDSGSSLPRQQTHFASLYLGCWEPELHESAILGDKYCAVARREPSYSRPSPQ